MHDESGIAGCPDDELVSRAQESDDAAFCELMRRTSASSQRLAMSILKDRQEAEDQVQNAYMKAWRHVRQFQREAEFSTWISRIVVNQCLMRLRNLRAATFVRLDDTETDEKKRPLEVADQRVTPEGAVGEMEVSAVLQREIHRLPALLQNVLVMRDVEELSTAEVARRLGISDSAVKSRLMRARAEVRSRLEKHQSSGGWATGSA